MTLMSHVIDKSSSQDNLFVGLKSWLEFYTRVLIRTRNTAHSKWSQAGIAPPMLPKIDDPFFNHHRLHNLYSRVLSLVSSILITSFPNQIKSNWSGSNRIESSIRLRLTLSTQISWVRAWVPNPAMVALRIRHDNNGNQKPNRKPSRERWVSCCDKTR